MAVERPLASAGANVHDEVAFVNHRLAAVVALERSLTCVRSQVDLHGGAINCAVATNEALQLRLSSGKAKQWLDRARMYGVQACTIGEFSTKGRLNIGRHKREANQDEYTTLGDTSMTVKHGERLNGRNNVHVNVRKMCKKQ